MAVIDWAERAYLPDSLIRLGIRQILGQRLKQEGASDERLRSVRRDMALQRLRQAAVAQSSDIANTQHYELPTRFFQALLGPHLKYSCAYWHNATDLAQAEEAMLALYAERARLQDGQSVLELGCGWGSLSLWLAQRFPQMEITAVSNSKTQKTFIDELAVAKGLNNLQVVTADVNDFATKQRFDRILTIEMLEHVRNYPRLFKRMAAWLEADGHVFAHIFCHQRLLYLFEDEERTDWMARYFFTGGVMPSYDVFTEFQQDLSLQESWHIPGTHYQATAEAWLNNMQDHQTELRTLLQQVYGQSQATLWWQRWRIFFMACAELFGYNQGREWGVGHYLWQRANAR